MSRVLAPFGRRRVAVAGAEEVGAYRVLHVADPEGPAPWPGQFYMLTAANRWGAGRDGRPFLPRAFSFLSAGDDRLSFLLEDVGPGTRRLAELGPGDGLWLVGPLGTGFEPPHDGRRAVLAGGGVGLPPLAAWADVLRAGPLTVSPLTGSPVRVEALLGFRDARHAEAAVLLAGAALATDDGSAGHHGPVTGLLARALQRDDQAVVYACGPPAMLEAVRALCAAAGVPAQLAMEAGMACGYGACYGCAVALRDGGYARICVDGPVLGAERLEAVPA